MRSEARLDSAVFQLTPTRTRCDLVIIANGKSEKIASGLLNPFLNHLKAAQDQISKGGYSITLEPDANSDTSWFTKGTVERFVRFVSTPEIVERVTTIESEILQIENAIDIQNNEKVEGQLAKAAEGIEGNKVSAEDDAAKAIVPYKPGSQPNAPDSNSNVPTAPEENSKVQLLRVLETRKVVLQKEQAMAFARAAAAGFDMDDMAPLISFAESFGASRLKEACLRFMELWKQKHETGQWIEVEALSESGFSYMNGSGIMLAADSMKQKEMGEAWQSSIGDIASENGKGEIPSDGKVPIGTQEHIPGQMHHPMYSQWPMYPPSGPPPVFPSYPGMPYYNYPNGVPYFHPPYPPPSDDPRFSTPRSRKKGSKKHSVDTRDSNNESEAWEQSPGSQDGTDEDLSDFEKESSHSRLSHKKSGRSGKKKPGVVVIKNLNYIAKKFGAGSDSQSGSDPETEEEIEEIHSSSRERKHKRSSKNSKKEESKNRSFESSNAYNEREENSEPQAESENWQVFQSFLLKAEEKPRPVAEDMFSGESALPVKGKKIISEIDPLVPTDRVNEDDNVQRIVELDSVNGAAIRMKQGASNDEMLVLSEGGISAGDQFKEIQGGEGAYRKMASDEFVIYGNKEQSNNRYSDPLTGHVYENATKVQKDSGPSYNVSDESFMLPHRSASPDHLEQSNRVAIEMDSEYPVPPVKAEDSPKKESAAEYSYEPDDFYLIPDREIDNASSNYDPAFEYDMQVPVETSITTEAIDQEEIATNPEQEEKIPEKDKKPTGLEKKRKDAPIKRGPPSRLNPLAEAQKRAEKLRTYKADLQKIKKEQEEEKLKRLEALKLERQKRIASRSGSIPSPVAAQNKSRVSTKPSPSPLKGSKFSDSEPRLSLPLRTNSTGSGDSKTTASKSNETSNGLTRSASSLTEVKRESNGLLSGPKATSQRINRLAEPKVIPKQHVSSLKSASRDQVPKKAADQSRKKITEIIQLDEKKSATLPELKIRTPKGHPDTVPNGSPAKQALQKESKVEMSKPSDNIHRERDTDCVPPSQISCEDNQEVEKTVVMLENRLVSAPLALSTKPMINESEISHENGLVPEYAETRDSPVELLGSSEENRNDQMNSYEVAAVHSNEVKPESIVEKSYEVSHVRAVTFLEEPARTNLESEAATISAHEIATTYPESIRAQPSQLEDISSVETYETIEKPRSKEAKGFRKLLKFGRKTHSGASPDSNADSDASSVDDHAISSGPTNDAHQLKNLISQDDSHPEGTPAKVSRPFSLLSPFRSKHSEKKIAA